MQTEEINTELDLVLNESGLILTEAEEIKQSYLPYFVQLGEIKELAKKINFDEPTELDEKIARELRLKTAKIRTGSEAIKVSRKKIHMLKADVEQSSWNLIKTTCLLEEENFAQVEKARERAEAAKRLAIKSERLEIIKEYTEQGEIYPLGEMLQESFDELINGFKLAKRAKYEAELKLEKERQEAIESEKKRQAEIAAENEKLKAEAIEKDKLAEIEKKKQSEALAKAEAEKRAIQDNADKERKEAEEKAKKEKEIQDKKIKSEQEKAAKEKSIADAKLKVEREAKEALEKELQDKKNAELKAKKEAEEKALAELKAKQQAEAKATKAPKKQKLTTWIDGFVLLNPTGMDEDETIQSIQEKFEGFKKWAKTQIENL